MSKDLLSTSLKNINPQAVLASIVAAGGIFFASQLFAGLSIVIVLALAGKNNDEIDKFVSGNRGIQLLLISLVALLVIFSVIKILVWLKEKPKKFLLLKNKLTLKNAGDTALAYGLYFIVLVSVVLFLGIFTGVDTNQTQDLGISSPNAVSGKLVIFIMLAVIPPIYEEILFRGFLFNILKKHSNVVVSYVLTSVLFGAAHLEYGSLNWIAAVDTMIFSGFLIYISQKHNSLYSAILLHAMKNSIAFYSLFVR